MRQVGTVEGCGNSRNKSKCIKRRRNRCKRDGIELGGMGSKRKRGGI